MLLLKNPKSKFFSGMQSNFLTSIFYKFKTQDTYFRYTTAQSQHHYAKGEKRRDIGEE